MNTQKVLLTGDMNISAIRRALESEMATDKKSSWAINESSYNSWLTDIINPHSILEEENPQFLVVLLSSRILTEVDDLLSLLPEALLALKKRTKMKVLFTTVVPDPSVPQPFFENVRLQQIATKLNQILWDFQSNNLWFQVLDFPGLATFHGLQNLTDVRYEAMGRMFLNPRGAQLISNFIARALAALTRTPKKVLALDLDNTLWGGVLGEDGPEGISCGGDGKGYAFLRFQKAVARLKANGILLAICSKNNESDVLSVFETHPDFHLRIKDFVTHRINWLPKAENLKSMADELNVNIDSFVFFDDSPFECEQVRQQLPMVDVIQAPGEPADYIKALSEYRGFDIFRVTDEDRQRSKQYLDEAQRQTLRKQTTNLGEFYASLDMKVTVSQVNEKTLPRAHQLIHKTNQFNLTTLRLDEGQLRTMLADPTYKLYIFQLSDRLGESGLIGLAILKADKKTWKIENFLMSCRVIGRTVEFALMRFIVQEAAKARAGEIHARFIPSARNQVAANYLKDSGFSRRGESEEWTLNIEKELDKIPKDFVKMQVG